MTTFDSYGFSSGELPIVTMLNPSLKSSLCKSLVGLKILTTRK